MWHPDPILINDKTPMLSLVQLVYQYGIIRADNSRNQFKDHFTDVSTVMVPTKPINM